MRMVIATAGLIAWSTAASAAGWHTSGQQIVNPAGSQFVITGININYAGSIGLHVVLDNHRSEAGNSAESNGLLGSNYTGLAYANKEYSFLCFDQLGPFAVPGGTGSGQCGGTGALPAPK